MSAPGDPGEWLVAHRGWPDRYPENSLEGMAAVLKAGARFVEFDVQITADGHPVVIHDDDLSRLAGRSECVTALSLARLQGISVGNRPGEAARVPALDAMLELVGRHPGVTAFVELKRHSIRRHGSRRAVAAVMQSLARASCPAVFLSFKALAVGQARRLGAGQVAWAMRRWSPLARLMAAWLRPDYLFVSAACVPPGPRPFWPGPWRWAVYDVADLDTARGLRARGAALIEVDDLPGLRSAAADGDH